MWWDKRRPELVAMFEKYVYGRIPPDMPHVTWKGNVTDYEVISFQPVIAKDLVGHVDNSTYPATLAVEAEWRWLNAPDYSMPVSTGRQSPQEHPAPQRDRKPARKAPGTVPSR